MRYLSWTVAGIVIVFLAAAYIVLPSTTEVFGHGVSINKGIDLAGGARVLLCAKGNPTDSAMNTARDVINSRAAGGLGVTEPQVTRVGKNCISVEMPGLKNQNQVINNIGNTGFLALTDSDSQTLAAGLKVKLVCPTTSPHCAPGLKTGVTNIAAKPIPVLQVVVPGTQINQGSAQVGFDTTGAPTVNYTLDGAGSSAWCTYTTNHVNQYSAIVLDGRIVTDPQIIQAICGGQTQITGVGSVSEATTIATYLNYGALPVVLKVDSSSQVDASLGPQYVHDAYLAGIIGLSIVALFMLLYYRLPGLLADLALVIYAVIVFALFKLIGVTMTLAGIAGFILSIGMAVDANILIFERMKEELRAGKTLGAAVESGFKRAFPSIRDSNASTLITTIILYWFGNNFAATTITGFATTLFIGVIVSFLTAYFVSRTFLRLIVVSGGARNSALYGVESMAVAGGRSVA
jgi:preprotein translocase subunit SecD